MTPIEQIREDLCDKRTSLNRKAAESATWSQREAGLYRNSAIETTIQIDALDSIVSDLSAATARAEKAEAERDALRKDKERLDWLEANYCSVEYHDPDECPASFEVATYGRFTGQRASSICDAIDAAIASTAKGGHNNA